MRFWTLSLGGWVGGWVRGYLDEREGFFGCFLGSGEIVLEEGGTR